MKVQSIRSIIRPCNRKLPAEPKVEADDKVSRAIELMVSHNLESIAVVQNQRIIGMICLSDAFKQIGLPVSDEQ